MSSEDSDSPAGSPAEGPSAAREAGQPSPQGPGAPPSPAGKDPLRGSRTSGVWLATGAALLLLILLIIFIAQNTATTRIYFLGFEGETPVAVALLIAAVVGMAVVALAATLRILQLRRRVRHDTKSRKGKKPTT